MEIELKFYPTAYFLIFCRVYNIYFIVAEFLLSVGELLYVGGYCIGTMHENPWAFLLVSTLWMH